MARYDPEEFFSAERSARGPTTLYLEVTKDRYELPVAVADSMTELARLRRVDVSVISKALSRHVGPRRKHKYVKVVIEAAEESDHAADRG